MLIQNGSDSSIQGAEIAETRVRTYPLNPAAVNSLIMDGNRAERLQDLGNVVLDWWLQLDNYQGGILYLYKDDVRSFVPLSWRGCPDDMAAAPVEYSSNQETFDRLFTEKMVLSGRHERISSFDGPFHKSFFSTLTMPMVCDEKKIGLLQLLSDNPARYDHQEVSCLHGFLDESALLLERMGSLERNRKRINSFLNLFSFLPDAMLVLAEDGRIRHANQAALQLLDRSTADLNRMSWQELLELDSSIHLAERLKTKTGSFFHAQLKVQQNQSQPVQVGLKRFEWDERSHVLLLIKPDMKVEANPRSESGDLYRAIFDHAADLICVYSVTGRIMAMNPAGIELLGYPEDAIIGRNVLDFVNEPDSPDIRRFWQNAMETGQCNRQDIAMRNSAGEVIELEFSSRILPLGEDGTWFTGIARNITERKRVENNLKYLSLHDGLTGLYNRHYFDTEMSRYENGEMDPIAIVICDIDGLKHVNDNLGHLAGDELLKAGARILKDSFRDGDIVARIGGDEFGILMPRSNWNGLRVAFRRLDRAVEQFNEKNPAMQLNFSRGCSVRYARFKTLRETMQEADDRMYNNKTGEKTRPRIFSPASEDMQNQDESLIGG